MAILISHSSALEFWRSPEGREWRLDPTSPDRVFRPHGTPAKIPAFRQNAVAYCNPCPALADKILSRSYLGITAPMHITVPRRGRRNSWGECLVHTCTEPIPAGLIVSLGDDCYLASPVLCLIQMASGLTFPELLVIACELAGTYRTASFDERGFVDAYPVLSKHGLASVCRKLSLRGVVRARAVARYIAENSASPMETALALLLSLPCAHGGYGLPIPELNALIKPMRQQEQNVTGQYYYGDLVWKKQRVAVEYDSDTYHAGKERIAKDAMRRNSLSYLGYSVVTVSSRQVMCEKESLRVAKQVAKLLGARIRPRGADWREKRFELRRATLPTGKAWPDF